MTYIYIWSLSIFLNSVFHPKKKEKKTKVLSWQREKYYRKENPRERSTKEEDKEDENVDFGGDPCLC